MDAQRFIAEFGHIGTAACVQDPVKLARLVQMKRCLLACEVMRHG